MMFNCQTYLEITHALYITRILVCSGYLVCQYFSHKCQLSLFRVFLRYGSAIEYHTSGFLCISADEEANKVLEGVTEQFKECAPLSAVLHRIAELLNFPGADLCKLEDVQSNVLAVPDGNKESHVDNGNGGGAGFVSQEDEDEKVDFEYDTDEEAAAGPEDGKARRDAEIRAIQSKKLSWKEVERVKREEEENLPAAEDLMNAEGKLRHQREVQKSQTEKGFQILAEEMEAIMTDEAGTESGLNLDLPRGCWQRQGLRFWGRAWSADRGH